MGADKPVRCLGFLSVLLYFWPLENGFFSHCYECMFSQNPLLPDFEDLPVLFYLLGYLEACSVMFQIDKKQASVSYLWVG